MILNMIEHGLRRTGQDKPSLVEDSQVIYQIDKAFQIMGRHNLRQSHLSIFDKNSAHLPHTGKIKPTERFVKKKYLGFIQQRGSEAELALHAPGQGLHRSVPHFKKIETVSHGSGITNSCIRTLVPHEHIFLDRGAKIGRAHV